MAKSNKYKSDPNPFSKVFFLLILFIILIYLFEWIDSNPTIDEGLYVKSLEGDPVLDIILDYFYSGLKIIVSFFFAVAFSALVNSWIINQRQDKVENEEISSGTYMIKKVFSPKSIIGFITKVEIAILIRLSVIFIFIWFFSNHQSLEYIGVHVYIFIVIYLSITMYLFFEDPESFYYWWKPIIKVYSLISLIFTIILTFCLFWKSPDLGIEMIGLVFIVILLLVESTTLLLLMSIRLLGLDLETAKKGKCIVKNQYDYHRLELQLQLGKYIKERNKRNLDVSLYLFIILILYVLLFPVITFFFDSSRVLTEGLWIIAFIVLIRLLSRSIELVYSFVNDVISKDEKSSDLDGKDRMLLAIKSLIEVTVIAAIIRISYHLYLKLNDPCLFSARIIEPLRLVRHFVENIFLSIATMGFNVSYKDNDIWVEQVVHLTQLLVSLTLITISIATYISMKDKSDS